ncbi:MAG: hypothetical protein K2Y39_06710 [Candidatus Obscuribacterales bacterium]|nr:hypothetical protein [Candidatus Obscuribacterales bacterium]
MRKLVSISCLLLLCSSWATAAHAQQTDEVAVPVVSGSDTATTITSVEPAVAPAAMPKVDFKVDLTGKSVVETDEMAAKRALRQYDESMRNWSLPPATIDQILAESRAPEAQNKFRLDRRGEEISGPRNPRTGAELEWSRQRFADRVADAIYPGFGRIETTYANGASSRLDYIYTKRCGGRGGLGICWQYRF